MFITICNGEAGARRVEDLLASKHNPNCKAMAIIQTRRQKKQEMQQL